MRNSVVLCCGISTANVNCKCYEICSVVDSLPWQRGHSRNQGRRFPQGHGDASPPQISEVGTWYTMSPPSFEWILEVWLSMISCYTALVLSRKDLKYGKYPLGVIKISNKTNEWANAKDGNKSDTLIGSLTSCLFHWCMLPGGANFNHVSSSQKQHQPLLKLRCWLEPIDPQIIAEKFISNKPDARRKVFGCFK